MEEGTQRKREKNVDQTDLRRDLSGVFKYIRTRTGFWKTANTFKSFS